MQIMQLMQTLILPPPRGNCFTLLFSLVSLPHALFALPHPQSELAWKALSKAENVLQEHHRSSPLLSPLQTGLRNILGPFINLWFVFDVSSPSRLFTNTDVSPDFLLPLSL